MTLLDGVVVRPSGETAVVLEVGDRLDPVLHDRVRALDAAISADPPPGVLEVVPTYRSVLLRIDHTRTTPDAVVASLAGRASRVPTRWTGVIHDVVVSFDRGDADDLDEVAAATDRAPDDVVRLLCDARLRVAFCGFVPGFVYLLGLPAGLDLPRRPTPRPPVQPGAVMLAAGQLALCPRAMPTGWYVVGRTDHVLFDPTAPSPVPFAAGDGLRLVAA